MVEPELVGQLHPGLGGAGGAEEGGDGVAGHDADRHEDHERHTEQGGDGEAEPAQQEPDHGAGVEGRRGGTDRASQPVVSPMCPDGYAAVTPPRPGRAPSVWRL